MSPRGHRPRRHAGAAPERPLHHGPAPANSFVAVLERRGRFLTAEPLFPYSHRDGHPGVPHRPRASTRVTLGPLRAVDEGRVHAAVGDLVLVHSARRGGGAHVARVLGRPDVAADVIEALLLDRGLARGFTEAVESEAADAAARVQREPGARRDLRHLPTFTVDPASARDFDDAISAERVGHDGRIRVWVHIADVAAHVPEDSLVDREARTRATSVYAPGAVEPMLPHALSSSACSLMPGVDRAAVTVELELEGARVVRTAFHRSLVRSDARLNYEQVDAIFAGTTAAAEPWGAALSAAREVAGALGRERAGRGALVVESEEPEFTFDEHGNVTAVLPRVQTESHRLIEHLMITANEAVAELLQRRGVPCLYRVHERPEPESVRRLIDQLASLEVPTPPVPERMSSTQAAELVGEASAMVDRHVRRTGRGREALTALILRSLMQAYYSPKNIGHAGLRSACYCHFTSPIRRYPDLVCHRALLSAIGAGQAPPRRDEVGELGAWTSERERAAAIIERDADDVARCFMLARLLREGDHQQPFEGEVVGLIAAGAFVAFGGRFEGMLPVRRMLAPGRQGERDWWELGEYGTILHGERTGATLRLGDPITVRVEGVDTIRGRVDLAAAR